MKKGQAQVITVILIVLLVLAAIIIVWQAVKTTIQRGSSSIEAQSACIGLDLTVDSASCSQDASQNDVKVTIVRGGDSVGKGKLKITVSDNVGGKGDATEDDFSALETTTKTITLNGGSGNRNKITVATGLILNPGTENELICAGSRAKYNCE